MPFIAAPELVVDSVCIVYLHHATRSMPKAQIETAMHALFGMITSNPFCSYAQQACNYKP